MISKPWLWTIILLGIAAAIVYVERSIFGWILAAFVLALILILWLVPRRASIRAAHDPDSVMVQLSQSLVGLILGIVGSLLAALLLPREYFSWLLILIGLILFAWLFWSRR